MKQSSSIVTFFAALVFITALCHTAHARSLQGKEAVEARARVIRHFCSHPRYIAKGLCPLNTTEDLSEPGNSTLYPDTDSSAPSASCAHGRGHRRCRVEQKNVTIEHQGCAPLIVTFGRCRGQCCSETQPKALSAEVPMSSINIEDFYIPDVSCCAPTKTRTRTVDLRCSTRTKTVHFMEAVECSCKKE